MRFSKTPTKLPLFPYSWSGLGLPEWAGRGGDNEIAMIPDGCHRSNTRIVSLCPITA